MRFTESEIQLASRLRGAGLQWQPQPGHFVFDIDGVVKAGSPFQASVHLMTSRNALETIAGGADALREGSRGCQPGTTHAAGSPTTASPTSVS